MSQHTETIERRERPEEIRKMFDAIAPTYDTLNHLMSFGLDRRWRTKAIAMLRDKREGVFLDIAAGSGDVSLGLLKLVPRRIVAVDFSSAMLEVFRQKLSRLHSETPISIVACDALSLPFGDCTFDGTIVAFGIRNFADHLRALRETLRVLKPGGIAVILELTTPRAPLISALSRVYASWGLPRLGKLISKHNSAYRYLPTSISHFPDRNTFLSLMRDAGFSEPAALPLSFGAATIYSARKPATGN